MGVKAKNVKKARVVGSGCFKIFKNPRHKGSAFLVKGSGILDLSEHGHTWTTVKSIQYSPDCEFPRRAGVEIYVIVGVVAVVLLVAVAAFTWSRFRKRRELTQVPTEDTAQFFMIETDQCEPVSMTLYILNFLYIVKPVLIK